MKKIIVLSLLASLSSAGLAAAQTAGALGNAEAPTDRSARRAAFLAQADTNGDGSVSPEEKQAAREARKAARFAKKDSNSDGRLTTDELPRMPAEAFAKLDANGDGGLTADEFKPFGRHGKRGHHGKGKFGKRFFEQVDANSDGVITKAEMRASADAHFKRMDRDGNGKVTLEEARKGKHNGKAKANTKR